MKRERGAAGASGAGQQPTALPKGPLHPWAGQCPRLAGSGPSSWAGARARPAEWHTCRSPGCCAQLRLLSWEQLLGITGSAPAAAGWARVACPDQRARSGQPPFLCRHALRAGKAPLPQKSRPGTTAATPH